MCIFHYFNYYLPAFVTTICLGFIFGFSFFWIFGLISLNAIKKPLGESSFLTRDQAPSLWSVSTDFKTLDYQRTNPREYQIVRTDTNKTIWIKTQHHPTTSSLQTTNKAKMQTQSLAERITTSLSLAHQRKNKQKLSTISPYMKLRQTTGPTLQRQKPKGRNNSTFLKERIQLSLKPMKRRLQTQ